MSENIKWLRSIHGQPSERAQNKVLPYLTEAVQKFIQQSPFAVMASSNSNGDCDASPRGGKPGFIKVLDEKTLLIPDIKGNRLFQSYENIDSNPKVGLLFMIPGEQRTARVNGQVEILQNDELKAFLDTHEVFNEDEQTLLIQGLLLKVDEAYSHCPRALQFSNLWGDHGS